MSHNDGESANQRQEMVMLRLADGSEVPEPTVITTLIGLEAVLDETGIFGATDARYLSQGQQPPRNPFGDTRPVFAAYGLGRFDRDGNLLFHDDEAAVVRNAVHINPKRRTQYVLASPLVPFKGFGDE